MSATPMMQQYHEAKGAVGDALLLFRMGDFYELFFEDAKIAAAKLGLALTSRDKSDNPIPMAGFPHHQLDQYLAKIIETGHRAAICEQIEDPRAAKGLVRREVTRIVSRGTVTDDALLDPHASNFLAAVLTHENERAGEHPPAAIGVAWIDVSTGQFAAMSIPPDQLADQLVRIQPTECLVRDDAGSLPPSSGLEPIITVRPAWAFDHATANTALTRLFQTKTLEGFGFDPDDRQDQSAVRAAGAILEYLTETQKASLGHVDRLVRWSCDNTLQLDPATRRSLEITQTLRTGNRGGSLLAVIDRTKTAMGARLLAQWLAAPLTDRSAIEARHEAVAEFVADIKGTSDLQSALETIYDIERLLARVTTGRASPRDLSYLARTLACLPNVKSAVSDRHSRLLIELGSRLDLCPDIRARLAEALADDCPLATREGGIIRPGFHPELDELRALCSGGRQWMAEYQSQEIERTGITSLKIGFNKVFGYFLEVTHAHRDKVPAEYTRKQTLKNAERYITPELKEHEERVLTAEERAHELEYELFVELRELVAAAAGRLRATALALAELDVLAALAELARARAYVRPEMVDEPLLDVAEGRHPVLDITEPEGTFVPNGILCQGNPERRAPVADGDTPDNVSTDLQSVLPDPQVPGSILLITGPNMAGKSTYIRQAALITLLAQIGSFVPARRARIGVADRIFARVGASDELARGQSTFMVEMTETARILHTATPHSLVILDEIGRGTSTYDGLSLAWSIVEHLHGEIGCRTLFATHYHELTDLEGQLDGVRNWNVAVKEWEERIAFLHEVVPGAADKSYGIHVAQLAGVPQAVNERAKEVLAWLERQHHSEGESPHDSSPTIPARTQNGHAGTAGRELQLTLFESAEHPLLEEIRTADVNQTTPLEALQLIEAWQKRLQ